MKEEKTIKKLKKLERKTFKGIPKEDRFEVNHAIGTSLEGNNPILLSVSKKADKIILQISDVKLLLNAESLDYLHRSILAMKMVLSEQEDGDIAERNKMSVEENLAFQNKIKLISIAGGSDVVKLVKEKYGENNEKKIENSIESSKANTAVMVSSIMSDFLKFKAEGRVDEVVFQEASRISIIIEELLNEDLPEKDILKIGNYLNSLKNNVLLLMHQYKFIYDVCTKEERSKMLESKLKALDNTSSEYSSFENELNEMLNLEPEEKVQEFAEEFTEELVEESVEPVLQEEPRASFDFDFEDDNVTQGNLVEDKILDSSEENDSESIANFIEDEDEETVTKTLSEEDELPLEPEEAFEPVEDDASGFVARMESLEKMLTGDFVKQVDEIPTLARIKEIKEESGDLAAKEYVDSLTQEQREELLREQMQLKLDKAAKLKDQPTEDFSEEK